MSRRQDALPAGWEQKTTAAGRHYYVDHLTRSTQWRRPAPRQPLPYHWFLRTTPIITYYINYLEQRSQKRHPGSGHAPRLSDDEVDLLPAAARYSKEPKPVFRNNVALAPHGRRVYADNRRGTSWRDSRPSLLINDVLPPGWEKRTRPDGRNFYVNHLERYTTWQMPNVPEPAAVPTAPPEPRIILEENVPQPHAPSAPPMPAGAYAGPPPLPREMGRVDASAPPMPEGLDLLPEVPMDSPEGLDLLPEIPMDSPEAEAPAEPAPPPPPPIDPNPAPQAGPILAPRPEMDHAPMPYDRDFRSKCDYFYRKLPRPTMENAKFNMQIDRDKLVQTSFASIMGQRPNTLHCRLYIKFGREQGLDYGGLAREWFELLGNKLQHRNLFRPAYEGAYIYEINPNTYDKESLALYVFWGRIAAMAVYHQKMIPLYLIRPFYKTLLGQPISLADMQDVDQEMYNSLKWTLENDPEDLCLNFTSTVVQNDGTVTEVPIVPDGENIDVTNENKKEYVAAYIRWRFVKRTEMQMKAFINGFTYVIPFRHIKIFDHNELELLICGISVIDVDDWEANTMLTGFNATAPTVKFFWRAVRDMNQEQLARLLQFATSSSRVPRNGFKYLVGSNPNEYKLFELKRVDGHGVHPKSHTCFNRIDMPVFKTFEQCKERLTEAVECCSGFDIQ